MKFALVAFGNEESYGLLFVGGELLLHRQDIRFFDAEYQDVGRWVVDWKPDFVMLSPMSTFYPRALHVVRNIKKGCPGVVSVFGGHHAMSSPGIIDEEGVDVVVVGPVRGSLERLLQGERGIIQTAPTDPSDMPYPARKAYYRDIPRMAGRYRKVMLSMLGCPWNCSYCSSASGHLRDIFGSDAHRHYYLARRPLATILAEAQEIRAYPTEEIEWVDDDVFTGPDVESWIPMFVEAWEATIGLPMYVSATSRSVLQVSDRVLTALRRIVNVVGMGVQAIRPESRRLFNRAWDSEKMMKDAYDRLVAFGYRVNLQCIVGLPIDDPVEDALDTIKGLQRIGPGSICSCYPLMIYPGTALEKYCCDRGIPLNDLCCGDTNSALPRVRFPPGTTRRLRNICKLGTLFVKYNLAERWMLPLLDIDYDEDTSRRLSLARYHECVTDRLGQTGERIFGDILSTMKLRY